MILIKIIRGFIRAELESEILQLRKALNEARLERDILKKATYFAQESLKNTR